MRKRKHVFRDDYEKEFPNVKQSRKGYSYAHCCYCDSETIQWQSLKLVVMGRGTARSWNQAPNNATQSKQKAHKQE